MIGAKVNPSSFLVATRSAVRWAMYRALPPDGELMWSLIRVDIWRFTDKAPDVRRRSVEPELVFCVLQIPLGLPNPYSS